MSPKNEGRTRLATWRDLGFFPTPPSEPVPEVTAMYLHTVEMVELVRIVRLVLVFLSTTSSKNTEQLALAEKLEFQLFALSQRYGELLLQDDPRIEGMLKNDWNQVWSTARDMAGVDGTTVQTMFDSIAQNALQKASTSNATLDELVVSANFEELSVSDLIKLGQRLDGVESTINYSSSVGYRRLFEALGAALKEVITQNAEHNHLLVFTDAASSIINGSVVAEYLQNSDPNLGVTQIWYRHSSIKFRDRDLFLTERSQGMIVQTKPSSILIVTDVIEHGRSIRNAVRYLTTQFPGVPIYVLATFVAIDISDMNLVKRQLISLDNNANCQVVKTGDHPLGGAVLFEPIY